LPVIIPVGVTVATLAALELHTPPLTQLPNVVVEPAHTDALPDIMPASGNAFTVTTLIAFAAPQLLVTL
jgi:hypothetical protein